MAMINQRNQKRRLHNPWSYNKIMTDELKHLNKDDLYLLMESYRNMIDMHNTLVNQQKMMIEIQSKSTDKQELSLLQQNKNVETLNKISEKLDVCIKTHNDLISKLTSEHEGISNKLSDGIEKLRELLNKNHLDVTKQHSTMTNKIYISMIGMATIVLALIGMAVSLIERFSILNNMQYLLNKIASYFNIIK